MKHVCKITHKSQTTCILRSIHAHFLQLLRDGALRACTCRRHGPNFEHFSPSSWVPLVPVDPPWSAERVLKARKEIRPHISVAHRRFPLALQAKFRAFSARLTHLSPAQRHFGCEIRSWSMSSSSSLFTFSSLWMLVVHRSLVCKWIRQLHRRRKAHRRLTDRHRETTCSRYGVMTQLYLGKGGGGKKPKSTWSCVSGTRHRDVRPSSLWNVGKPHSDLHVTYFNSTQTERESLQSDSCKHCDILSLIYK